ncbi:MAG TPA: prepilin-type N-terminal cleavage/methylation domain-containing protein [Fimbriimonas sp.]|nr:prepilin-type N-terminal cleavage/methylation domain-containing protein [Fimbriimonas sp.]
MIPSCHSGSRRGFTLIELLVVIAIIAILAAILFPVFAQAKVAAKKTADLSNVKQLVLGTLMYNNDNDDANPFCWGWGPSWMPWHQQTESYVKNIPIWKSPVDNWGRGTEGGDPTCIMGAPTRGVTYSMNFTWPAGSWGWSDGDEQNQMSPTSNNGGATMTSVPAVASTILIAPRPNWYHQWCEGWATEVFFNYDEFNMQGGGANMFNNGTNYGLCDGHAKFMTKSSTLKPQGNQASMPVPADWPGGGSDPNWPWPVGMWDKRQ